MLKKIHLLCVLFSLSPLVMGQDSLQALEGSADPSDAYDCTIVELGAVDGASFTNAERIAQMDAALLDSIDKHDNCIDQVVSNNAASGSGQDSGFGSGGEGADGNSFEDEDSESRGSEDDSSENGNSNDQSESVTEQANNEDETNKQRHNDRQLAGNGAKNQDIAAKDNDSAVCRLLKDELKIETDPKKQSELKEIYNSYHCRG